MFPTREENPIIVRVVRVYDRLEQDADLEISRSIRGTRHTIY